MKLPASLTKVINRFTELPSIGPRQATRLAFYLVNRGGGAIAALAKELEGLSKIKVCERCFFVHENSDALCDICRNPARDHSIILVLEKETDMLSVENTGRFTGRYFVIGPISKTGMLDEMQKMRLQSLKSFIKNPPPGGLGGSAKEVIIGLNPTSVGDFHAGLLAKELAPLAKKLTRLGRGLPTGGEIEFADDETLGSALQSRN